MLAPVRTAAPGTIVSVADLKANMNVTTSDDDDLIGAMGAAVESYLDGWSGILGKCLLTQTWRQDFARFPGSDRLRLPLGPVASVTSVTYYDANGDNQTLSTSVYVGPFHNAEGPYLILKYGQVWPNTYTREDAVSVTFIAGSAAVKQSTIAAIRLMVGDLYQNRESVVTGTISSAISMTTTVDALLANERRVGF